MTNKELREALVKLQDDLPVSYFLPYEGEQVVITRVQAYPFPDGVGIWLSNFIEPLSMPNYANVVKHPSDLVRLEASVRVDEQTA